MPGLLERQFTIKPESSEIEINPDFLEKKFALSFEFSRNVFPVSFGEGIFN